MGDVFLPMTYHPGGLAASIAKTRPYESGCIVRTYEDGSNSLHPAIRYPDGRVVEGELPCSDEDFSKIAGAMRLTARSLRDVSDQADKLVLMLEQRPASTQAIRDAMHDFRTLCNGMASMLALAFASAASEKRE